ncbi:hypothetical protein [Candidatus Amarolinea dominans]|uniref:hypothetical protein n=1 Tax=Candidatus Amarolinea dominans TaxID=3140696 RepID=UPI001DDF9800|nr:hypothetical protein [Anaerolineae bacterium]
MSEMVDRNDEVLAIFQRAIPQAPPLRTDEPFAAPTRPRLAIQHALHRCCEATPLALIGITSPNLTPNRQGFVGYLARRARARRAAYLVLTSQRETLLIRTPRRDGDALEVLRAYPTEHLILSHADDALSPLERAVLTDLALRVAVDLATLHSDGHLDLVIPDADFSLDD